MGVPLKSYFQVGLSILGLVFAINIWQAGHPIWAIVVGVLFIGGMGWVLLWRLASVPFRAVWGLYLAYGPPKMKKTSDEFLREWDRRQGQASLPPRGMYHAWRDEHQVTGITVSDWMDRVFGVNQPKPIHVVHPLKDVEVTFYETAPGEYQWAFSRELAPGDPMGHYVHMRAEVELTKLQLMAGREPHFPEFMEIAEREMRAASEDRGSAEPSR